MVEQSTLTLTTKGCFTDHSRTCCSVTHTSTVFITFTRQQRHRRFEASALAASSLLSSQSKHGAFRENSRRALEPFKEAEQKLFIRIAQQQKHTRLLETQQLLPPPHLIGLFTLKQVQND